MMNQWRSLLIELLLFVILKTFLFFFLAFGESFLVKNWFLHFIFTSSTSIFVVGFDLLDLIV